MLRLSDLTVYLVEPSSAQQRAIITIFNALGVNSISAFACASDMIFHLSETPPGVVVSALYLPDMTGTELVQALRSEPATEHLPFILISSETRPQVLDPVRQSGVCGILPKPFTSAQLLLALRATLDYLDGSPKGDIDEAELETLKVLLVDDSPSARKFSRRVLENLGIVNFFEADSGRAALEIMSQTMVDLVVTDYNMPEMDGKELIEFIRKESWQNTIPILMVTSESDMGRLAAVEELGVSGICDKPFEPSVIRSLLIRIMNDIHHND